MDFLTNYDYVVAYQQELRAAAERQRRASRARPVRGPRFARLRRVVRRPAPSGRPRVRSVG